MRLQQIFSKTRQALDAYNMIREGDKIAVGLSGGKDSITLLYSLSGLQHFYPITFEIVAICVNLGFENQDLSGIKNICDELKVPLHIVDTQISKIIFDERKETNPCALCSKMRKGALNQKALELGCNKVAYGHHRDDVVETMMLSLLFEGRFYTFSPVTYLDNTRLTVIRPFLYLKEADIQGFINKNNIAICKNKCPADGYTKRQYIKELIRDINFETKDVKDRLFSAIENGNIPGWSNKT